MALHVTIGFPTNFPSDAVVDFLLDPDAVEGWLGEGARLEARVGGAIVVPPGDAFPGPVALTATVQRVRRTHSSFTLKSVWDNGTDDAGLIIRVTTRPEGKSRVRITATGVPPDRVVETRRSWTDVAADLNNLITRASAQRRSYRQAIVVVHGIGEQRPTSSLRNFVEAIFPEEKGTRRFVKPDYVSPLVGANSVTVPGRWTIDRPTTDVYEFYWAHLIRDTTVGQVYSWAFRLLLKTPRRNITPKLRRHVYALRILIFLVVAALVVLAIAFIVGEGPGDSVTALVTGAAAAFALVPALVWKIGSPLHNLIVADVLGDAARYFDTSPANVQVRQRVRETGLQLLNDLHDRERYSRVIVYGHSLGSVIAYDILAHCWTRRSRLHTNAETMRTPALRAVEDILNPPGPLPTKPTIDTVRERQHAAWNEFTGNGFKWLVSDLVTAGSPLTHARWLLNPDEQTPFDQLVADRSMPTCPPQTSWMRSPKPGRRRRTFTFTHAYRTEGDKRARSVLVPDHGALFGLVRWSNLYFPHTRIISGDPVGGPLQPTFGRWVHDVPLPSPDGGFAHTKYVNTSKGREHVDRLREALALKVAPDIAFWVTRADASERQAETAAKD